MLVRVAYQTELKLAWVEEVREACGVMPDVEGGAQRRFDGAEGGGEGETLAGEHAAAGGEEQARANVVGAVANVRDAGPGALREPRRHNVSLAEVPGAPRTRMRRVGATRIGSGAQGRPWVVVWRYTQSSAPNGAVGNPRGRVTDDGGECAAKAMRPEDLVDEYRVRIGHDTEVRPWVGSQSIQSCPHGVPRLCERNSPEHAPHVALRLPVLRDAPQGGVHTVGPRAAGTCIAQQREVFVPVLWVHTYHCLGVTVYLNDGVVKIKHHEVALPIPFRLAPHSPLPPPSSPSLLLLLLLSRLVCETRREDFDFFPPPIREEAPASSSRAENRGLFP